MTNQQIDWGKVYSICYKSKSNTRLSAEEFSYVAKAHEIDPQKYSEVANQARNAAISDYMDMWKND